MSQYGKEGADERIRRQGELQRLGKDQGKREINIKKRDFKAPRADSRPFIPGPRGERRHRQPRPHPGRDGAGNAPKCPKTTGKPTPEPGWGGEGRGRRWDLSMRLLGSPGYPRDLSLHFGITWNSPMWILVSLGIPSCGFGDYLVSPEFPYEDFGVPRNPPVWVLGSPGCPWNVSLWILGSPLEFACVDFEIPQEFPLVGFGIPWVPLEFPCVDFGDPRNSFVWILGTPGICADFGFPCGLADLGLEWDTAGMGTGHPDPAGPQGPPPAVSASE